MALQKEDDMQENNATSGTGMVNASRTMPAVLGSVHILHRLACWHTLCAANEVQEARHAKDIITCLQLIPHIVQAILGRSPFMSSQTHLLQSLKHSRTFRLQWIVKSRRPSF